MTRRASSSLFVGFVVTVVLICLTVPVRASSDVNLQTTMDQDDFKRVVRDVGVGLSYIPSEPAEAQGVLGFQAGVNASAADLNQNSDYMKKAYGDSDVPDMMYLPKLQLSKGLLPNLDVAGFVSGEPGGNIRLYGGAIKYSLLEGGVTTPAVAVRGHGTLLDGVDDLELETKGLDLSISKGFANVTPFAGYSLVDIDGDYTGDNSILNTRLDPVSTTENRIFAGTRFSLGFVNLVAEADFSEVNVYSLRANIGF